MNNGESNPNLELAFEFAQTLAKISGLFNESYDGGDFCRGLIFAKEASTVVFKVAGKMW